MKTGNLLAVVGSFIFVLLVFTACPSPWNSPQPPYVPPPVGIIILWKGENASAPIEAESNWAYYNVTTGTAYIYDGASDVRAWLVLPQSGISLIWKGEALIHPDNPEQNWAYYNSTDKITYIYSHNGWQELLSGKVVTPQGLLLENMMLRLPAGTFTMGSPADEPCRENDETQHQVILSKDFYLGRYPVTNAELHIALGTYFDLRTLTNLPETYVNWYDAIEFCNKLSMMEGLSPVYSLDGETDPDKWETRAWNHNKPSWDNVEMLSSANGYRLPTEAEWEYACRAGTSTAFNWGTNMITTDQANYDGSNDLYNGSPAGLFRDEVTAVGTFAPNAWGLYDMHGNIEEWCWDWYGADYYGNSPEHDPYGPASGSERVIRGGSCWDESRYLRSASRHALGPGWFGGEMGFRLARSCP
jgi:formylglycine-generating enzyme required for sulfatase activity